MLQELSSIAAIQQSLNGSRKKVELNMQFVELCWNAQSSLTSANEFNV